MKENKREFKITSIKRKIIENLAGGFSDREIGEKLGKTYYSVRKYIFEMEKDTGTKNRPHLVNWAYKNGVLKVK